MGIDQNPAAAAATGIGQVYHHNPSVMGDIKASSSIVWTSARDLKRAPRYCTAGTSPALDEDEVSFGVFQGYGGSNLTGGQFGILEVIADVTFLSPY